MALLVKQRSLGLGYHVITFAPTLRVVHGYCTVWTSLLECKARLDFPVDIDYWTFYFLRDWQWQVKFRCAKLRRANAAFSLAAWSKTLFFFTTTLLAMRHQYCCSDHSGTYWSNHPTCERPPGLLLVILPAYGHGFVGSLPLIAVAPVIPAPSAVWIHPAQSMVHRDLDVLRHPAQISPQTCTATIRLGCTALCRCRGRSAMARAGYAGCCRWAWELSLPSKRSELLHAASRCSGSLAVSLAALRLSWDGFQRWASCFTHRDYNYPICS